MKKFQKNKVKRNRNHPGEIFRQSWNERAIRKEIRKSQAKRDLPRFALDKVEIHLTKSCNLECPWCYGRAVVPPMNQRKKLSSKIIGDILEDIKEEKPLVIYAGLYSEPLMHNDFSSIIQKTGQEGFRFGIYTNGSLMTSKIASAITQAAKKNKNNKPSYITFNLSSSLETNSLEDILLSIKKVNDLREENQSQLLLNGSLMAYSSNLHKYSYILEETKKRGIDNIRLSFPWSAQKNESNNYKQFSEEFLKLKKDHPDLVSIRFPPKRLFEHCFVGTQALSISSEGDVFPCPEVSSLLFRDTHSYGNVYDKKISQIWHSEEHKKMFLKLNPYLVEKKCVCCHMDEEINRYCSGFLK